MSRISVDSFSSNSKRKVFLRSSLYVVVVLALLLSLFGSAVDTRPALAADLSIKPITWNIIGLDSNNVMTGPENFPVGARVCGTPGTTVTVSYHWDDTGGMFTSDPNHHPYINLRDGTNDSLTLTIATDDADGCTDAYFEVTVNRLEASWFKTRSYYITATYTPPSGPSVTVSTPRPRELYVEKLISQDRNETLMVWVSQDGGTTYTKVPAGAGMPLMVDQDYFIKLEADTATNGYENIETFINLPNTIFQILSVNTTYTAPPPGLSTDTLYEDACTWENLPSSPNYRSCLDVGKAGGEVTVIYEVHILSAPEDPLQNPQPLTSLIYDFSGSSYHYNADFKSQTRYVEVVSPDLSKSFDPVSITPDGVSLLTITIPNPYDHTLTGVNFEDIFPAGMTIADTTSYTSPECGTPSLAAPYPGTGINVGATSFGFWNGTIQPGAICTITLNVTAHNVGTYVNETGNLWLNGTTPGTGTDTGNNASATLLVYKDAYSCDTKIPIAHWTVPGTSTVPPDGPIAGQPTIKHADVNPATMIVAQPNNAPSGAGSSIVNDPLRADSTAYNVYGWRVNPTTGVPPQWVELRVDTADFSGVEFDFWMANPSPANGPDTLFVEYSINRGGSWLPLGPTITGIDTKGSTYYHYEYDMSLISNRAGETWIHIYLTGAPNNNNGSGVFFDDFRFIGCRYVPPPDLEKTFSPEEVEVGQIIPLTFNISNYSETGNDSKGHPLQDLINVWFTDTLPDGLLYVDTADYPSPDLTFTPEPPLDGGPPFAVCEDPALIPDPSDGSTTLKVTIPSLLAGTRCSVRVYVRAVEEGDFINTTSQITSDYNMPGDYGGSTLYVVRPPTITKTFGVEVLNLDLDGNTTTLSFTITNPNRRPLTSVAFTDDTFWPAGLVINHPYPEVCTGMTGGTLTITSTSISLSGGTLPAYGSCTFTVTVEASTVDEFKNTTSTVTGSIVLPTKTYNLSGGPATDTLWTVNSMPGIALMKQVGTGPDGPWYDDSWIIPFGSPVYYRFTVENTGDVDLTNVILTDDKVNMSLCSPALPDPWTLPAPDAIDDDHIFTCVVDAGNALKGYYKNTAEVTYDGAPSPVTDDATYLNSGNFGHLPYAMYPGMNLFDEGGAMNVNGTTYLGSELPGLNYPCPEGPPACYPPETDGSSSVLYQWEDTDEGIGWVGDWGHGVGYASLYITCPVVGTRTVYGWFDWNQDGVFSSDPADLEFQVFTGNCNQYTLMPIEIDFPGTGPLTKGDYYARFRIYDKDPGADLSPAGASGIVGEIEDYIINSDGSGDTPTPVTIAYFKAERQGGTVIFNWSTATEMGNAGFNIFVLSRGDLTRVNAELIPSRTVDSLSRQDYSYEANTGGSVFYIEEVDLHGYTRRHGPFKLGEEYGSLIEAQPIDWQAIQKASSAASALRADRPRGIGAVRSLNVLVNRTGMVRMTYEQLLGAGLDLNGARTTNVVVTLGKTVVPIYMKTTYGKFGPGTYIEFYGQALDTLYTDTNVYTIQYVTTGRPSAITSLSMLVPARVAPVASYLETVVVNNQKVYSEDTPGSEPWYDKSVYAIRTPRSISATFNVSNLAPETVPPAPPASLNLVVWGRLDDKSVNPDHHMLVSINGTQVAEERFDGFVVHTVNATIPAGVLHEGANELKLTLVGDTGASLDLVALDKFSVSYQRQFVAQSGQITFNAAGRVFQVTNLPTPNVVVYRLTNGRPVRLATLKVAANGSTYTATFAGSMVKSTYYVSAAEALYNPAYQLPVVPANLDTPAQYLVIAHPDFIGNADLARLLDARRAQGFTVNVVNVEHLYAKYTYGVFDPKAIKDHISYAAQKLGAQYVLLVGGDTYDYRNHLGVNSISFIPSLYVQTGEFVKFVPGDPLYADYTGDNVPDLALGRLPVRTPDELKLVVDKTLAYQSKDYAGTATFVSDKRDGMQSFKNMSLTMSYSLPSTWTVENIHLDKTSVDTARTQLLAAMNRGTALVNFVGHSSPDRWSDSYLFSTAHAASLTNAGRPFVVVQWGCWNNYYVEPVWNTLVQAFLFSGDRGAAATLGATTKADSYSELLLGRLLTPRLATPGMSLGQAMLEAKQELAVNYPDLLDVLLGWNLMGDPALIIQP